MLLILKNCGFYIEESNNIYMVGNVANTKKCGIYIEESNNIYMVSNVANTKKMWILH